ncbi:MAG TPA: acyl-CoA desaturase [Gemmataceae bacterium]|nr:acyl-CoA desaturase [Gemmataceae bacterium]
MSQAIHTPEMPADLAPTKSEFTKTLKFGSNTSFQVELRRRVDEFFRLTGRRQRDCPAMYLKSAILFAALAGSYTLLVFYATEWWQAVPAAILLALSIAGIGFNIQHDAGHGAYSNFAWINKLMAMTLDLIGGSSYAWHWKHAIYHHTNVNVAGHDTDIELGMAVRFSPHQKRYKFHRWQHLYMWPLYGIFTIKWHFLSDFQEIISGRIGKLRMPRPRGWDLVVFLGGKATFFTLAFVIPLLHHSVWAVMSFYGMVSVLLGIVLSIVFQLAHAVEEAAFPLPQTDTGRIENAWAIHQVETSVDYSRRSRVLAWLLGGLNYQIEHHLLTRVCHVNYPAISKVVEETCRDFGVKYTEHKSFAAGLASHFRWLKRMGVEGEGQ